MAPRRWRGVRIAFADVFGARALLLTARGILEGLGPDEEGVGRPCIPPQDFGVVATDRPKANLDFNIPPELGTGLASFGVGGCSAELVADIDVKLGVVS